MAPKYLWWEIDGTVQEKRTRLLAQIMNLGTYDDIRTVEAVVDREELADVLRKAQPGWFSPRSWDFWKGRLGLTDVEISPAPPQRVFHDVDIRAQA